MRRIYAIQQNNDYVETNYFFDFEQESKEQNFAILGGRDFVSFTFEEYDRTYKYFDDFLWEFEQIINKTKQNYYNTFSSVVNAYFPKSNGKKYTTKEVHKFKLLYEKIETERTYDFDDYDCEILSLITSNKYNKKAIRGYCQGDYAEIVYPATIENETIDYIEACYFGTGTQYIIYEEETDDILSVEQLANNCENVYFDYTALWNATLYKQNLAQRYNLPLENIIVYEITNTKQRIIIENEYAIA